MRHPLVDAYWPIACFEHAQAANWPEGRPERGAFAECYPSDLCKRLPPVLERIAAAPSLEALFSAGFIDGVNRDLCAHLGAAPPRPFAQPDDWRDFVLQISGEFSFEEAEFLDAAAWILAQLHWVHLSSFRLLTGWLIVEELFRRHGRGGLRIDEDGLGALVVNLAYAGPHVFDAEPLRGDFDRYIRD